MSALTKRPRIDKRATGGLNLNGDQAIDRPASVFGIKENIQGTNLKKKTKKIIKKTNKKKNSERQRDTKHRDQVLVFVNPYFLQKWQ